MADFFENPILNSPYAYPGRHWELDDKNQPLDRIIDSRRRSQLVTPIPATKKQRTSNKQREMSLYDSDSETGEQQYSPTPIINEIRQYVEAWRTLPILMIGGLHPIPLDYFVLNGAMDHHGNRP